MLTVKHLFALTGIRIKNWSIYRFDFFASIMGMILPIIALSLYWLNALEYRTEVDSFVFTSKTIIVYYIIAFAIDMLFSFELAFSVEEDIATGKMNAYLTLPCSYITVKLSEFFAGNLLPISLLFVMVLFISLTPLVSISLYSLALFLLFVYFRAFDSLAKKNRWYVIFSTNYKWTSGGHGNSVKYSPCKDTVARMESIFFICLFSIPDNSHRRIRLYCSSHIGTMVFYRLYRI